MTAALLGAVLAFVIRVAQDAVLPADAIDLVTGAAVALGLVAAFLAPNGKREAAGRMRRVDAAWTAVLTAVILGPLLTGWGFWLFGDMVFVPEQPWKDAWLGLDGTLRGRCPWTRSCRC